MLKKIQTLCSRSLYRGEQWRKANVTDSKILCRRLPSLYGKSNDGWRLNMTVLPSSALTRWLHSMTLSKKEAAASCFQWFVALLGDPTNATEASFFAWIFKQAVHCTYCVTSRLTYLSVISSTHKPRLGNSQFDPALRVPKIPTNSVGNYSVSSALIVFQSFSVIGR